MILTVLKEGNPALRQPSLPVEEFNDGLNSLISSLISTCMTMGGIGISAIQCGIAVQVCVVSDDGTNFKALINPKITKSKGIQKNREGCLSLPGKIREVERPAQIEVEYYDVLGKKRKLKANKLLAACISHEIDHFSGKLIIDYA